MSITLTKQVVLEQLEKAVAERGADYISPECTIFERDSDGAHKVPVCIVGQVIYQLVGDEEFQDIKGGMVINPLHSVNIDYDLEFSDDPYAEPEEEKFEAYYSYGSPINILKQAQDYQDGNVRLDGHNPVNGERPEWGKVVEQIKRDYYNG